MCFQQCRIRNLFSFQHFLAFVASNRLEKNLQVHGSEGLVTNVYAAACYDLDQQSSDLFMKNSVISDPEPLEQTVDISHLSNNDFYLFLPLKENYKQIFSTHKHSIRKFPYWKCSVKINQNINCRQKQCSKLIPKSAYLYLMKYKNACVFCGSLGAADKYLANNTLTRRPSACELKHSMKADKYICHKFQSNKNQIKLTSQVQTKTARNLNKKHKKKGICSV